MVAATKAIAVNDVDCLNNIKKVLYVKSIFSYELVKHLDFVNRKILVEQFIKKPDGPNNDAYLKLILINF